METITSRANPLCVHLRKLASSASYRRKCGEFVSDSPKLLEEALLWQGDVRVVVRTEGAALPPIPEGVRQVTVPPDVMKSLSPTESPQGALAVLRRPAPSAAPAAGRPPVRGAGRCPGPGQRGDDPPHGGCLP